MNEFNISQENWDKIIDYARIAYDKHKSEIGGMAVVCKDDKGNWDINDPVILKQEISVSNTSIDKEALAKYYTKTALLMEEYQHGVDYRFLWWHSHHTMSAFWSGTDHEAINEFSDGDMSFALVVNLKEEYKFRISIWKPIEVAQDVTLNITDKKPVKVSKKMVNEVEKLCEKETLMTYHYNGRVRNAAQSTLWGDREDAKAWNESFGVESADDIAMEKMELLMEAAAYDPDLERIMQAIDDTCDKFIEGIIDVDVWHKKLTSMESKLSNIQYDWMIKVPSKANAFDKILTLAGAVDLLEHREVII